MIKAEKLYILFSVFALLSLILFLGWNIFANGKNVVEGETQTKIRENGIYRLCVDGFVVYHNKEGMMYQRTKNNELVECDK